jgi:hypothetical protein
VGVGEEDIVAVPRRQPDRSPRVAGDARDLDRARDEEGVVRCLLEVSHGASSSEERKAKLMRVEEDEEKESDEAHLKAIE